MCNIFDAYYKINLFNRRKALEKQRIQEKVFSDNENISTSCNNAIIEQCNEIVTGSNTIIKCNNETYNESRETFADAKIHKELEKLGLLEDNMLQTNSTNTTLSTEELCIVLGEENESESEEPITYAIDSNVDAHRLENAPIEGNFIINFGYFFEQLHAKFDNHSALNCNFRDIVVIGKKTNGLKTTFKFQCRECHYSADVCTESSEPKTLSINEGAVAGSILTGIGYSQMEEIMAAMNIKNMSYTKYKNVHDKLSDAFETAAKKSMKEAGEEERKLAIERKDIVDKIPHIAVVADGSWMKRSYRTGKYDSSSGAGVICGVHTNKVLHIGIRNKFCATCNRAEKLEKTPSKHKCYKNWNSNRSSTSMEADAIAEGFKSSLSQHGLIYSKLIADGDSSVYKKIRETNPYKSICVEKIECKNHLLRNLMGKIKQISAMKGRFGKLRQVFESRSLKIRNAITKAVKHHINQNTSMKDKIILLKRDIMNVGSHVFGEHKECARIGYFCDGILKENMINYVPELSAAGFYVRLQTALKQLSWNAKSLLCDQDSNRAESFNAMISKCIGGKRINFGLRGSYETRCNAAVLAFNTHSPISKLAETLEKHPGEIAIKVHETRKHKYDMAVIKNTDIRKKKRAKSMTIDKDYGPTASRPDVDIEELEIRMKEHMDMLYDWQRRRIEIQEETKDQGASELWHHYRVKLLTASHFGSICKMRPSTSCVSKVKTILYPQDLRVEAVQYGAECEEIARREIETTLNVRIERCGLFIDEEIPFLGASPDGLINDDGVVEIKCPFAARLLTPEDAIKTNISNMHSLYK